MGKIKSFFQKLNSASPAAKAAFWFVVSNICLKGISFITTPIFTRLLEIEDYGVTSVFVTWENVIGIFATLSLSGGVYNVAMTKHADDIDRYTSSMLGLTLVSSTVVYAICILINVIYPPLFELSNVFLVFMWIQNFTTSNISFWLMRKRYLYDYKSVITYTITNALLSPIVAIIAVSIFTNNQAFAKVIGAGSVGIVIGTIILIKTVFKGKTLFNKKYWGYALKFNLPLLPHYLSGTILSSSDKLMINSMVGTAEAGIYSISHSITGIMSIVTQSINYSLIPYTLQSIKQKNFKGLKKTITLSAMLIAIISIIVTMFAKEGVLIFATKEYLDAVKFIPMLAGTVLFHFVYGIIGNILFYHEKTGVMSFCTIVCAVLNLILNYFGIKYFGYIAAGYTTLICSIVQFFIVYLFTRKYEKNIDQIVDLKQLFAIFIVFGLFMVYSIIFATVFIARAVLVGLILIVLLANVKKIVAFYMNLNKGKNDATKEKVTEEIKEG